ncbi:DUF2726 domain-containing protein [Roseomonas rosulenta]|uniref:DUF2726 domain-containing protein n=1 Tax=Roseomonas rosulenta TaxID=2748667 RepID=UPI0018DF713B|nr:DUF2726 domain-containing protein [Roseomonas rosulenta]
MSTELALVIQHPLLPIALWVIGIGVGMGIEQFRSKLRRNAWRKRNPMRWERRNGPTATTGGWPGSAPAALATRQPDAADQLRIVMGAAFSAQPLLNKSEARVLKELERFVEDCNPQWQVMAQVSVGEILRSKDTAAFTCINSKRVDLLLIDGEYMPRHALEYQGWGHHQGTAAARDAVKKEALRRAGIGYHEVVAGQTTPSELRRLVEKLVPKRAGTDQPQAPPSEKTA